MPFAPTREGAMTCGGQTTSAVPVVGIALGAALLMVDSSWRSEWPRVYRSIQGTGLMLIGVGIFGHTWCQLYIGA